MALNVPKVNPCIKLGPLSFRPTGGLNCRPTEGSSCRPTGGLNCRPTGGSNCTNSIPTKSNGNGKEKDEEDDDDTIYYMIDEETDSVIVAPKENASFGSLCGFYKVQESTIPRALLRRYFRGSSRYTLDWDKWICCVLSSFDAFEKAIRLDHFNTKEVFTSLFVDQVPPFGFPVDLLYKVATLPPKTLCKEYSIFLATYLRIYNGYWMIKEFSLIEFEGNNNEMKSLAFAAQLFCDTHIDLVNAMVSNNAFRNSNLLDPLTTMDDLFEHLYAKNYPHDARFYYSGDLPNLIPLVDTGGMWYHMPIKASRMNIVYAIVHVISCKTQPFRCQGRNNMAILTKKSGYFARFPDIEKLYEMILRVSLLGNYGFARVRPCFEARMETYRFFSDECISTEERIAWISEYDSFIKCIAKEYLCYLFKSSVLLDIVYLTSYLHSSPYVQKECFVPNTGESRPTAFAIAIDLCDNVRYILSTCATISSSTLLKDSKEYPKGQEFYLQVSQALVDYQSKMELCISKVPKMDFMRLLHTICTKIYKKKLVDPFSTIPLDLRKEIGASSFSAIQICLAQYFLAENTPLGRPFPLYWFKVFGLTYSAHKKMQKILYGFLFLNKADHSIEKKLEKIANQKRRDFFIVYAAYDLYLEFEEENTFVLPKRSAQRQETALRYKYHIQPWESTPLAICLFYYCQNCKKWANDVIQQPTHENSLFMHSFGGFSCRHDTITDTVICGNEFGATAIRVLKSKGTYELDHVSDPAIASIILKHRKSALCTTTEMRRINMIGIVKKLGKNYFALCEICATLCIFTTSAFSSAGFTCQCHVSDPEWFSPVRSIIPPQSTTFGNPTSLQSVPSTSLQSIPPTSLQSVPPTSLQSIPQTSLQSTPQTCFYCKNERKRNESLREICLFDDMETYTFQHLFLCRKDHNKLHRVADTSVILRKSIAFGAIKEQRENDNERQKKKPPRA